MGFCFCMTSYEKEKISSLCLSRVRHHFIHHRGGQIIRWPTGQVKAPMLCPVLCYDPNYDKLIMCINADYVK